MSHSKSLGFDYSIKRSARRRTASIKIEGGEVRLSVPVSADLSWINEWVETKADWIRPRLMEQQRGLERYQIKLESREIPIGGQMFELRESAIKGNKQVVVEPDERLILVDCDQRIGSEQQDAVRAKIQKALRQFAIEQFEKGISVAASETGLEPKSIEVRSYRRKWGQCSSRGKVSINWRCIHLREELQRYVMIHELCHLKEMNHSANFWALVEIHCPEFRQLRKELQSYAPFLDW